MVLDLKDIFAGGESIAFDYKLDMRDFEASPGVRPISDPVRVTGSVTNHAGAVTIDALAQVAYYTQCDRCLTDITERLDVQFSNMLATETAGDVDDDIIVCEDQTLDLDELVIINIILNLSMKHLCSPDCKGLCPKCGKNLNEGDCGCEKGYVNPVFSQLKDLIQE